MSEEPVVPVGEDNEVKPVEVLAQDQDKKQECDKDTELTMLEGDNIEDEKMPSYMNTASISSSITPDHSRIEANEQTQPQLEGDEADNAPGEPERENDNSEADRSGSSVVEVTSGDESEQEFDGVEDDNYMSDEEEEDDDDDDEDEDDEMDYDQDDERDYHRERAEYMRRHPEYDEESSDGEMEPEQFERSSDDFVLRPTEALEGSAKERSRSLQDLTSPSQRTAKFNSKRQFHPMPLPISELDGMSEFHVGGQRRGYTGTPKYSHVTSKVKQYIVGIKEQSRLSREKKARDPLDVNREFVNVIKRDQNMETDIRVNPQSRLLKSYMESNLKHMIAEDPTRAAEVTINHHLVENGAEIISVDTGDSMKKSYDPATIMEVDKENEIQVEKSQRHVDKKTNGMRVELSDPLEVILSNKPKDDPEVNREGLTNGEHDAQQITNCQSVSYEDFLKGTFESNRVEEVKNQTKIALDPLQLPAETKEILSSAPDAFKIEQVKSAKDEIVLTDKHTTESPEISILKAQLAQKSVECDGMKQDYKMIVNKNFQLKNEYSFMTDKNQQLEKELSELKKTLAQYQKEKEQQGEPKKSKVMREAEVQTESLPAVFDKSAVSHLKFSEHKASPTSITSTDQWTDSNCSPSVSLKPPTIGSILNSDDSLCLGTPQKTTRPISQAFYTSSRILQTLANITQGKQDPANPCTGGRRSNPGQSKEPISPLVTSEYRSRKRKASDSQGTSGIGPQPFKMPFMSNKLRKEYNSDYETDAGDKTTMDQTCSSRTSQLNHGKGDEDDKMEEIDDNDGIKCYIYKEDDDSKERSFLLQAEEINKVGNNKVARECGPFLLANLEVRMSEANGTLNIWGREIQSQESDDIDEDLEEDPPENDAFWSKTPVGKMRTPQFACSTNKKPKLLSPSAGVRSRIPRKLRSVLSRVSGANDDEVDRPFASMPNLENHSAHNCIGCDQKPRGHSPLQTQVKNATCCVRNHEMNDCEYETAAHSCGAMQNMGCRGVSISNPTNLHLKHSCPNYTQNQDVCRHHVSHPTTVENQGVCHAPKRCHSADIPCSMRIDNNCARGRIHSEHSVFATDNAPLISSERASETSDNIRRRLSGKRVRGILRDFLKGCGDCRNPHTTSLDANHLEGLNATVPDIRVTPAHDNLSENRPHSLNSDRAGSSLADFQIQFEQLMVDVEKINKRSRTLFQMMNTLRNTESQ